MATNSFLFEKTFCLRKLKYTSGSRTKSKNSLKRKIFCVSVFLSVCMSARGRQYLEETKLRVQEGQRARTEARIVQLTLTDVRRLVRATPEPSLSEPH